MSEKPLASVAEPQNPEANVVAPPAAAATPTPVSNAEPAAGRAAALPPEPQHPEANVVALPAAAATLTNRIHDEYFIKDLRRLKELRSFLIQEAEWAERLSFMRPTCTMVQPWTSHRELAEDGAYQERVITLGATRLAAIRTSPLWQQKARQLTFDHDLLKVFQYQGSSQNLFQIVR